MPKFVGSRIEGARRIHDNAAPPLSHVPLTYAQARLLPASEVVCSLDTTDKGSAGCYAKRWFRWFAHRAAVMACKRSTPKMLAKVA